MYSTVAHNFCCAFNKENILLYIIWQVIMELYLHMDKLEVEKHIPWAPLIVYHRI